MPWAIQQEYITPDQGVANFDIGSCEGMKGLAYWISNNKCQYSFNFAVFEGLESTTPDQDGDTNIGFQLKY